MWQHPERRIFRTTYFTVMPQQSIPTSALSLFTDRIVITIPTVNPAEDAMRYMKAMLRTVQVAITNEYIDTDELQDVYSVLELLNYMNPFMDERELKKLIKRSE